MRYSGIQPQYFPRLHYFARILNTDVFMVRDDAQFVRKHKYPDGRTDKSYQADTPIKQSFGIQLLHIPTQHNGFQALNETKIAYSENWVESHVKTIQSAYGKASEFKTTFPHLAKLLKASYHTIAQLNLATILWGIQVLLGEKTPLSLTACNELLTKKNPFRLKKIILASQTEAALRFPTMTPNEKIVALCKETGATEDYCGGTGVAAYVDHALFEKQGIKITVQDWKCREYVQQFKKQQGFLANLSIIDLLMNVSVEEAREILS